MSEYRHQKTTSNNTKTLYIFVYLYIGQSVKEVNLAEIKNCLTLVVKVENLKLIAS